MANQQSVCEMFSKWSKHDFVKNNIICFKISVDFETWLFYFFSTENQCFEAQWVLWHHRQLDSV